MKRSYIDYAMSVIVGRALPDVRDGLKPVHRRILYAMNELGMTPDKPFKKCARIVGEVLGKYHPHGDTAVYEALVRMAQDFSTRYLTVDGHGNFGSVDGDGAAAMRYTEARMNKITPSMLADIDCETVEFEPNFDGSLQEPSVLPVRLPMLLLNGVSGIAVGMATNIPPHNLCEVVDGTIALIDNPQITIAELMEHIKGPDFPTAATIIGLADIKQAYETGRGSIKMQAVAGFEEIAGGGGRQARTAIVITEIPYQVNKAMLIEKIADLVKEQRINGISDIRDESDRDGMRIVIQLKTDANANVVLNKLYKLTAMQSSFSVNNVALVHGRPRTLNLKEIIQAFNDHRYEVVTRRTEYQLGKARERAHILEGLMIAVQNIDEVIAIIRRSKNADEAKSGLSERFGLSEPQTQAIVDMRLRALTNLAVEELQKDIDDIHKRIAELELILSDPNVKRALIESELREIADKYGDARRTKIDYQAGDFNAEDFYADDDMVITISHLGYIKRTPLVDFRAQNRGGVGSRGSVTRDSDFIEHIYTASMHNYMFFFTDKGLVYKMRVYELPEFGKNSKGRALQNLLNIEPGDKVRAYIRCPQLDAEFASSHYLVFATKQGVVKKTLLSEYVRVLAKGKKAIVIRPGDKLIGVELTDGNSEILMANRHGRAIRFHESELRAMGRVSAGVRGMRIDETGDDAVVGLIAMPVNTTNNVLVLSQEGYGKRSLVEDYRITRRASKGVKTMNVTDKTGELVGFESVNDDNDLMIINKSGVVIRVHVADIRVMGRATQGVRIINLQKRSDAIASVCCVEADPEEEAVQIEQNPETLPGLTDTVEPDDDIEADDIDDAEEIEETDNTNEDNE